MKAEEHFEKIAYGVAELCEDTDNDMETISVILGKLRQVVDAAIGFVEEAISKNE